MRIAVICSLEYEINKLREFMDNIYDEEIAGTEVLEGVMGRHSLFLAASGVGKVNAAATAQAMISEYTPDLVVNIGLAGNCTADLPVGGAVIATELCYHDMDLLVMEGFKTLASRFATDLAIQALAKDVLTTMNVPFRCGVVATGDRFINSPGLREDIVRRTGCLCVDMDGAAVANVCQRNSMPLVAVRVLSDDAGDTATSDFSFGAVQYSELAAEIVCRICRSLYA